MKYLSVREAQELDRRAREKYFIPSILLMEHAAQAVVEQALKLGRRFTVVAGTGNNGGDGLAAARLLHQKGCRVSILPLASLAGEQAQMVRALKIPRARKIDAPVVIDALFGIGLNRDVTGRAADLIARMNASRRPIVAVDIPSGLDGDTGLPRGSAVRAALTVTFGFPKMGFRNPAAKEYLGRVVVADIGYPQERR